MGTHTRADLGQEFREEAAENSPKKKVTLMKKEGSRVNVSVDPLVEYIINGSWKFELVLVGSEEWANEAVDESQSLTSCPFPLGFRPCTKEKDMHKKIQSGVLATCLGLENNKEIDKEDSINLEKESDDELLKNLVDRNGNKKKVGGLKLKKSRASQTQRILLGSSKRILQTRFSSCKEGHKDMSKKEPGGTAREVKSENRSEINENNFATIKERNDSEKSDGTIEEANETKYACEDAGMNFDEENHDVVLRDILNTTRSRRRRQDRKHGN
ncbi:hypothetical protein PIB30_088192 [Stylosanthes scabra]|uniref:Uncharacterized protein n=1 Tax=Stylosanthes scabra TaxID=79078 RepID=A0ABU6YRW5_9FABA|nr:hypothetical protein [Stylosanthes scabra]